MIPNMLLPVQRSLSAGSLDLRHLRPARAGRRYYSRRYTPTPVSMGPVSASVLLYVAGRLLNRISNGQLMRRGVFRKMRRMGALMVEWHLVYEVLLDCLEDMSPS